MIYAICQCVMPVEYKDKLRKNYCKSCGGFIDTKSSVSKHPSKKPKVGIHSKKYIACLNIKCAKVQRHVKSCAAYGENYPVNFIASKVKNRKMHISYYDENWSTIKRFDDELFEIG